MEDPYTDVAVLKIDISSLSSERIKHLPFGNSSKLRVGEQILAVGNPQGLTNTVTYGIISRLNGSAPINPTTNPSFLTFSIPNMIQIDADVNRGNSGGPLINLNGDYRN